MNFRVEVFYAELNENNDNERLVNINSNKIHIPLITLTEVSVM